MASLSRLLTAAGAIVLLLDTPALLRATSRRGRKSLMAQVRLTFLWFFLRYIVTHPAIYSRLEKQDWVQKMLRIMQSSVGCVAINALVPATLAIFGLPLAAGVTSKKQQRRFLTALIYGSIPTLAEALQEGFGEDVDAIAVLALELGILKEETAAAGVILLMLSGGEALERFAFTRARQSLKHVLDQDLPVAHRVRDPERADVVDLEDVDASEVCCGDVLLVRVGEVVPVDGYLLHYGTSNAALVDESLITGESGGTTKVIDDLVMSGSVAHQPLRISVKTPFAGSTLELMRQALQDALEKKGALQERSAKAAFWLKPLTLAVAGFALLVRLNRTSAKQRWDVVLSVLMSATPCPASIGVPVSFLSGMGVAARHGVLIKSGAAIEHVSQASHIVLDKTGTLTLGKPVVRFFHVFAHVTGDAVWRDALQLVASLEVTSTHPCATALRSYAEGKGMELLPAEDAEHVYGCGVVGMVNGRRVLAGTAAFLETHGISDAGGTGDELARNDNQGSGALLEVYFAVDGNLGEVIRGVARLEDPIREGTAHAIKRLQQLGLEVSILSGDRSYHVDAVAQELGIQQVRSGCLPQDKAKFVQDLASSSVGKVIMVGDEGNDAPALAEASVGIAVGTSGLACQSADVVITAQSSLSVLNHIVQLIHLSRVAVNTASRGVRAGLGISTIQVCAAGTGRIAPRTNAILQELLDFSTLVNAISVLRHTWAEDRFS
eukprot:TRINITY_DN30875_c0_g1_i1.p1 TRINITY_DN30875_c0_g1~~TRINITY_DN30875_c0_g1_i1.p1  ORF type:complete len:722 (+),score=120.55 TRINITY_DN30875_c0_g1_i1:129-2294(+)